MPDVSVWRLFRGERSTHQPNGNITLILTSFSRLSILLGEEDIPDFALTYSKKIYQLDIPPPLEIPSRFRGYKFPGNSERLETIARETAEKIRRIARPRAVYTASKVKCVGRDFVDIDGIRFESRILNKKLCDLETVYPFIATIGKELDDLKAPPGEMWQSFILDSLKTMMLIAAVEYVTAYIKEEFKLGEVALMNPGELKDWPINQQAPLFELFGGEEKAIGVSLSRGGAMRPLKSRSGIVFPDDTGFVSCRCCNQENCPGRRAKYDPELVEEYMK
jgi:hypothetical protein